MGAGFWEFIITVTVGIIGFTAGRYYTYNHPMKKKMQQRRQEQQEAQNRDTTD